MIELPTGVDLWDVEADAVVITTNGDINKAGRAVMGRGCALEAKNRYPGIDSVLAGALHTFGNHVHLLFVTEREYEGEVVGDVSILSFPVKRHWHEPASLDLIERSAYELAQAALDFDFDTVAMPRPGCGNGRLSWSVVKPVIEPILDDRFIVVHK